MPALPRAFRCFWWGEAVSGFGNAVTGLALQTLVVVTLGGTAVQVGWLNAARWLPYLVVGLVVGALVDRVRRRPVMVATDLLRALLLALVPFAWALGVLSLPLLLGVVLAFGAASLVNDAASQSFVPRLVPRPSLQRAHARLDGAAAVAQTAGPAVAGLLVRLVGAPLAVLVDAASYAFSAAVVASLPDVVEPSRVRDRLTARDLAGQVVEGVRWVYGRSGLARLAVATHVWFVAQAVLLVVAAPYAFLRLHLSALQLGLVYAVAGVGALVGAVVSTAVGRRVGTGGAIVTAHLTSAVGALVMLAALAASVGWPGAAVLAAGQLLHGWAMGLSNSHEMSYRQALTPDALQARTNTTMRSLNRAVVVVVSPLAGLGADRFGYGWALGAVAAVFTLSGMLLLLSPFRRARAG
ncbi:Predicted arabinose efflux permease, MFS family [Microlunatus flavus]|uniref:Predicted arabinose efflux permease, MFS family n=1 Tax=Microlunatus flavus TaxID=1036181 RepID=A0A1H9DKY6_9ACTN|nr:Predicted arabinose efflux permease, MFS family [Microlunatus flavus]